MDEELIGGDSAADTTYLWTIRVLYGVAIALNVWLLWGTAVDDAQTEKIKRQANIWKERALRPFHIDRLVKRQTGQVLWQATKIVEEAESTDV